MRKLMESRLEEFRRSVVAGERPAGPPLLLALWHEARGDWDEAHRIAQTLDTAEAAQVHAYLHRREGDLGNARYWYRRAGCSESTDSLDAERHRLVAALLESER